MMEKIKILYAEDDPADAQLTIRHLQAHAPAVVTTVVTSARECLERLDRESFDLILLDYRLPDRDGLQVLSEIMCRKLQVPVVMVTGFGDTETAVRALKAGAYDYVVKKENYLSTLPAVIQDALSRFRSSVRVRMCRNIRVLYVEDSRTAIELAERSFKVLAPHLTLEAVPLASECLRLLEMRQYDALLTNYRLPDMDGLELVKEIRRRQISVPVVMITGEEDEEVAVQALKLGAYDYVVKREGYLQKLPTALENALTQHHLTKEREALITLHSLAQAVASARHISKIFTKVIEGASVLLEVEKVFLHLLSEDGSELAPVMWKGIRDERAKTLRFKLGGGLVGWAARERKPMMSLDLRSDERTLYRDQAIEEQVAAALSVPLLAKNELLGVLSVATRIQKEFSLEEQRLLGILADHTAVAIENARFDEELRLAATHLEATVEERTRELEVAKARLEEALHRVEEASRHKSDFLASMSHELRTPLNSILGFSELLEDQKFGPLNEKQQRYVHNIWTSGKHLLQLITDILDLSKVEAGRIELHPEPFSLPEALRAALNTISPQAKAKDLQLQLNEEACPPTLIADPTRFKQILYNLLSNAVKFTPAGGSVTLAARLVHGSQFTVHGEHLSVSEPSTVNREPHRDFVEISVQDTGIGIKPEDMPKLFQEFTQLDASLAKRHQGTGLGLALTKRLVELHGGEVRAESAGEGKGSTFTVTLPLRPPQRPRPRLLLVDDDAGFGEALATALEDAGYESEVITDGQEALARLEQHPPDLLLLDVVLPGCDGREILRTLRAKEATRHLPVIAFTGVDGISETEVRVLGADEFLTKPFSTTVLLQVIGRFLGHGNGTSSPHTPPSA